MTRVPLRFQLTRTECGAACLAMVLSRYGRDTSVPECRALLGTGRDGVSVSAIAAAAEQAGLAVGVERSDRLPAGPLTGLAIAYLARHHFVVVVRADDRRVSLVDPGVGRQRLSRAEFDDQYGGVLLRLSPTDRLERRRTRWRDAPMVRYLHQFASVPGGRRLIALTVLFAAGLQALGLGIPLLTKLVVDTLVPAHRTDLLPAVGAGIVAVGVAYGALTLARGLALLTLRALGDRELTHGFVKHLFRLPIGFFLDRGRGDLLMRLSSVSTTRETLSQQLLTMIVDGFLLIGYLIAVVLLSPLYLLPLVPLAVAQALVLAATYRRLRVLAQRELTARSEEQSYLVETLEAVIPLKANGVEERAVAHWRRLFDRYQRAMVRRGRGTAVLGAAQRAVGTLGPLALLWFGAGMVLSGRLSLGAMLAANAVALSILSPLETFAGVGQLYHAVRAQVERLFDVLDTPAEQSGTVRLPADEPTRITVRGLGFRYHDSQPPILTDVGFDLPPGGKLGVVGRTGSGKSTLGLLLLGLLRPTEGEVRHDGVAVAELDVPDLRSHCGAVLQELTLFNGSIRDNLVLSRPDATDAEVIGAARAAGLHDDVLALPMGYDTLVGEGGTALSAGQRQRIALARALVHRPRLLVLDEATSHLDPQTEREVDAALARLAVTRVVISHRLSAIRGADQILVLDRGRVVQRGGHDELVAAHGRYRQLFGTADSETRDGAVPSRDTERSIR
ncbi:peptidase domain-containing ABC transporter [Actinocatenispora comari]|uniref:Peptidase C39 n=1 Tax=Actinocatenispora comari TaxID=2807577 RepID=A0A8J4AI03_9ACTN|nr:peptidase domain-containing ABC transporter [Actinocatenispora comari]GIL31871.1 peptidase C39 [Actinocatenispora comari]